MRLRSLAPLIVLFALGCRPRSESGETPDVSSESTEPRNERHADASSTKPARPPGAIYRDELVRATRGGNAPYLLAQLGPEAYSPQGRFEGWIITRVWPGDPELCASGCDLRVGDIILSVNNSKLETPEQLSNLLADLDAIQGIELTGIRDGEFFERSHSILPDAMLAE
jgi:type II secretory pathway component PulC